MSRSSVIFGSVAVILGLTIVAGRNEYLKPLLSALGSSVSDSGSSNDGNASSKKKIVVCTGMKVEKKKLTEHGTGPIQSTALLQSQEKAQQACDKVKPKAPCPKECTVTHMGGPIPVGKPVYKGKKGNVTVTQTYVCTRSTLCAP